MTHKYEIEIQNQIRGEIELSEISSLVTGSAEKTYDEYVEAGKRVVKSVLCHQALLAFYALKVCTIRHGGKSDHIYTISKYADDIGVNRKTLQNWTLVYRRVIIHLGIEPENISKKDWQVASRISYSMDRENTIENKTNDTSRKRLDYKEPRTTPKRIRERFDEEYKEPSFESEAHGWNRAIININHKIKKRDLSLAPEYLLLDIMKNIDEISDFINEFLTCKRKKEK